MVFNNLCILVLWMKVALALEGLICPFPKGSFRLKWSRGWQVTISDFDKTALMCAFMFKKVARKISVQNSKRCFEKSEVDGMGDIAHIFNHESRKKVYWTILIMSVP